MAVVIVTGVPGTGKTLYGIQKYIIPHLRRGGIVYTNISGIVNRRISMFFGIDIFDVESNLRIIDDPAYFYKDTPKNCLFVIDEAQNIFSNRDWQKAQNAECISYLNEHRHYGHRIVFITPHLDSVDAGIRRVVEFTYKHKSFSAIGDQKTVRCAVFDQCNISKGPLQTFTWKHDVRIYDCYSSYFAEGTTEKKVKINIFRNTTLYMLGAVILVCSFLAIKNGASFFGRFVHEKKPAVSKEVLSLTKDPINVIKINDSIIYGR